MDLVPSSSGLLPKDPKQWLAPEQREPDESHATPIDARGACWGYRVLPALDLRGANLCRADLRGTDLSACQLENSKFILARYDANTRVPNGFNLKQAGAVGPSASLNGAFLNGADLRGMDLRHVNFMGAYLSGSDLSGSVLDGASFVGADLRFAKLQGCHCVGTRFAGCQLNQADFRAAVLTDAALDQAESIQGADFSLTSGLDLEQLDNLLKRQAKELDCWNPLTRQTTRSSLTSLRQKAL
jgi:uncharacterized protein YjbI with pentapeptide repeats